MGQNAVGNLSIVIGANAAPFDATVGQVERKVAGLGGRMKPPLPIQFTTPASMGGELEKVRKSAAGGLGFGAATSGAAKFVGALGAVAVAGAVVHKALDAMNRAAEFAGHKVLETIEDKARLGAAGQALGLTARQFTGVAGVAKSVGEDSREFIESLVTMGKLAADGAAGNGLVAPAFFKDLNLDAREFVRLRADEQFFRIFESLEKVQDPLTRTRALMVAFGEDGGKFLLPLLSKSAAEVRRMAGAFAVSDQAMGAFRSSQAAVSKSGVAWDQAWTRVSAAAAPVVEVIANDLAGALDTIGPKFDGIGASAESEFGRMSLSMAYAADVARTSFAIIGTGTALLASVPGQLAVAAGTVGEYAPNLGLGINWAGVKARGASVVEGSQSVVNGLRINNPTAVQDGVRARLAELDKIRSAAPIGPAGGPTPPAPRPELDAYAKQLRASMVRDNPGRKLADETLKLNEAIQASKITMGEFREGARLAWREYANDAPKALAGPLEQLRETQRVMAIGVRHGAFRPDEATDHVRGAFDNYARDQRDQFERNGGGQVARFRMEAGLLNQQASPGLGLISRQQADAGIGRLAEDLAKVFDRAEAQLPAAMLAGSQEAESVITKAMTAGQGGGKDPTARIVDAINKLGMKELTEEKVKRAMGQAIQQHLKVTAGGV